jgi:hypothetical protein
MASTPDARLADLAARQHGVVSRTQARTCGLTDRMIEQRLAGKRLVLVARGVLRVGGARSTWRQQLMAACLAAGPGSVVSHRSAAALFGLDRFAPGPVEITLVRPRRYRAPRVTVHTTAELADGDVTTLDGIPVTRPVRTLIDLAAAIDRDRLEEALDAALRDNLLTLPRLERRIAGLQRRGRSGIRVLAALISERAEGEVPQSVLERRFLRLVKQLGLPKPVCQLPVRRPDGSRAYLDFAWVAEGVAVEVDGHRSHSTRRQRQHDNERSNDLAQTDFRKLLRFTWEHVTCRQDYVARMLFEALGLAA